MERIKDKTEADATLPGQPTASETNIALMLGRNETVNAAMKKRCSMDTPAQMARSTKTHKKHDFW